MKDFLREFKAFAVRGNVLDLAIAVIIGTAFGKIVSSLVDAVIMPLIGLLLGGINFSGLEISLGGTTLKYGVFLQSVIDFVIIAFVIFLVIQAMGRFKRLQGEKKDADIPPTDEVRLLTEIRDLLRKE